MHRIDTNACSAYDNGVSNCQSFLGEWCGMEDLFATLIDELASISHEDWAQAVYIRVLNGSSPPLDRPPEQSPASGDPDVYRPR